MSQAEALTEKSAYQAARAACRTAGIDDTDVELIRLGSNAVFRLADNLILRISRIPDGFTETQRQVDVARWLASEDYPANRVADVTQPVDADGYPATFWISVSEDVEYAPIGQVAEVIRDLHQLTAPSSLKLPEKLPFKELEYRLDETRERLHPEDLDFVLKRASQLRKDYEKLQFDLPTGVIHGDANVGNVIVASDGTPCLIDLDSFAAGPREWDLVQTALFYERFGWHTEDEYREFVEIYGFDIMSWPGYVTLADYREIAMTLWLAGKPDDEAVSEVRKRFRTIRTDGDRKDWAPF